MKEQSFYRGVWITLFAAIISIGAFYISPEGLTISLIFSVIALIAGFQSLRVIHKYPKYFKGEPIVITCIVIVSVIFITDLLIHMLPYIFPDNNYENISITSDEEAIKFVASIYSWEFNLSNMGNPVVTEISPDKAAKIIEVQNFGNTSFDTSKVYNIKWEKRYDNNLIRKCSTTFTHSGEVIEELNCIIS